MLKRICDLLVEMPFHDSTLPRALELIVVECRIWLERGMPEEWVYEHILVPLMTMTNRTGHWLPVCSERVTWYMTEGSYRSRLQQILLSDKHLRRTPPGTASIDALIEQLNQWYPSSRQVEDREPHHDYG